MLGYNPAVPPCPLLECIVPHPDSTCTSLVYSTLTRVKVVTENQTNLVMLDMLEDVWLLSDL